MNIISANATNRADLLNIKLLQERAGDPGHMDSRPVSSRFELKATDNITKILINHYFLIETSLYTLRTKIRIIKEREELARLPQRKSRQAVDQ